MSGCLNLDGQCCFNETGCEYNNGHNTCIVEKDDKYFNPMPKEGNPTINKLRCKLNKYFTKGHAISREFKKGDDILGRMYYMGVFFEELDGHFNRQKSVGYLVGLKGNQIRMTDDKELKKERKVD